MVGINVTEERLAQLLKHLVYIEVRGTPDINHYHFFFLHDNVIAASTIAAFNDSTLLLIGMVTLSWDI